MKQIVFDYHYGIEAEQYAFYRIPKILMRDPLFKMLSLEAKVLYGMMMDRLVLSAKNGWKDERGRIYIYFTIEDICEAFMCGKDKAVKVLKELEKGDSLIERKKQGQGKTYEDFCKEFYKSIYAFDGKGKTAKAYEQFTKEVLENEKQCQKNTARQL